MGKTTRNPVFKGKAVTASYTLTANDFAVGVDTSGGDVPITIPTASTVAKYPRSWFVKKMTGDTNRLIIQLQTPSDSMFGVQFSAMEQTGQGQGVEILLNANGQYTFSDWSGVDTSQLYEPAVVTLQPTLSSTTLTMNGEITEMGAQATLDARFRYRDVTAGTAWVETTDVEKSAMGTFSDTATVTAGNVFEVQALVETVNGHIYYGAVLDTDVNYYSSVAEALLDGLDAYWPMQESAGTDTTASETMDGLDMTMYSGVTIGSDTINSNTIYKRIFGADDYGQATYKPDIKNDDYTFLIQVDMNSSSGDHTIMNMGRNRLSLASDGSGIQLEVRNNISTWASATPFSGILNLFITVDQSSNRTTLYTCTSADRTQRAYRAEVPNRKAVYLRLGRGTSGDANHQDDEYADDMIVRSIAAWARVLSEIEMEAVCDKLDNDGELVVA